MTQTFKFKHKIYFNETNAVGGVAYFSNFVKWQGMVREEYFVSTVPEWQDIMKEVSSGKVNMITVEEHSHFIQHAYFGDTITIHLRTANLKRFSFDMIFKVYRNSTEDPIYDGWQRLAFDDYQGHFIPIPEPMRKSIANHLMSDDEYDAHKNKYAQRDRIYDQKLFQGVS